MMKDHHTMELDYTTTTTNSSDSGELEGSEGEGVESSPLELNFETFSLDDKEIRSDLLSIRQAAEDDARDFSQASRTLQCQPALVSHATRPLAVGPKRGEKNSSVNARRSDSGHTLLDMAAAQGHLEGLEAVLARGADVNANLVGRTALHIASFWDQAAAVDILCASGARVDDKDDEGCTPLHVAAAKGATSAIIALVHHGASQTTQNGREGRGLPPFLVAVEGGHLAAATVLLHAAEEDDETFVDRRWGDDEYTALDLAARAGHREILRMIIRHGADVDSVDSAGVTALYLAALNDQACCVHDLAGAGGSLGAHANGRHGRTALHVASMEGSNDAVRALLKCGAPQHEYDFCHHTPLHLAAAKGDNVAVKMLLAFGSDPTLNSRAHSSRHTPLDTAASVGNVVAVRAMIVNLYQRAMKKPSERKSFTERVLKSTLADALGAAAKSDSAPCIHALVAAGAGVEGKDAFPMTPAPIHLAAGAGAADAITALARHGADVNRIGDKGRTPLHTAVIYGSMRATEALLKAGADIGKRCYILERPCTALDITADRGQKFVMDVLIEHGADVNAADPDMGITPLHIAARIGFVAPVNMLLDAGAAVSTQDHLGSTPLHAATAGNALAVIRVLTKRGADVNKKNHAGKTPLHLAAACVDPAFVRALVVAGADVALRGGSPPDEETTALDVAAMNGHAAVVRTLVVAGAEVDARDRDGWTALMRAVKANQPAAVAVLAVAGANLEAHLVDESWTSLHSAAEDTHLEVVQVLLMQGASVHAKDADNDNDTPLHVAVRQAGVEGAYEIVEALLRYDADESALNDQGLSPVSVVGNIVGVDAALPVMALLERAPGNRLWRRRGLLILCCARAKRGREGESKRQEKCEAGGKQGGFDGQDECKVDECEAGGKMGEVDKQDTCEAEENVEEVDKQEAVETGGGGEGGGGSDPGDNAEGAANGGTQDEAVEGRCEGDLQRVAAWLLGLQEEGLFRIIVGFL